jgi:Na+/H+-translocating membrane pyrophosphatase
MYTILMIFAGCVGLIVTGAAFYTVWSIMDMRKQLNERQSESSVDIKDVMRTWTAMDYGAIAVFVVGMMLLIADLLAVIRDRDSYPYYHYGYLFCAIIFVFVGMMFMVIRLGVIVRSPAKAESTFDHNYNEPEQTDQAHERI